MGPLTVLRWANRALYLLLFVSLIVVMGYWHISITYTFLGSVFCLIMPTLFLDKLERYPKVLKLNLNSTPRLPTLSLAREHET